MKPNKLSELSDAELLKKMAQAKGVMVAFGIVYLVAIGIVVYLFSMHGFNKRMVPSIIPIFTIPILFLPITISFGQLMNESKARNIK